MSDNTLLIHFWKKIQILKKYISRNTQINSIESLEDQQKGNQGKDTELHDRRATYFAVNSITGVIVNIRTVSTFLFIGLWAI